MNMYVYRYVYVYMYVRRYVCMYAWMYVQKLCVYIYICVHTKIQVVVWASLSVQQEARPGPSPQGRVLNQHKTPHGKYVRGPVTACTYTPICAYIYIYICIYMYRNT